ncbi:hypothetical protein DY000_02012187 [Brassica cretica]|uniref:Uncharacterized protein n=1 Tax=Brassica cretica TaxID=69181 RepID=A0ABQ7CX50_BRACR|nr:hypothetical protein DY000_02012187 [Brassica cretica]
MRGRSLYDEEGDMWVRRNLIDARRLLLYFFPLIAPGLFFRICNSSAIMECNLGSLIKKMLLWPAWIVCWSIRMKVSDFYLYGMSNHRSARPGKCLSIQLVLARPDALILSVQLVLVQPD